MGNVTCNPLAKLQGWVMRSFAQTNARLIRTMRVFNVNASAIRGQFLW